MKYGQQRLVAGRKNYIFFLCPLDGEQFIPVLQLEIILCIPQRAEILPELHRRIR